LRKTADEIEFCQLQESSIFNRKKEQKKKGQL